MMETVVSERGRERGGQVSDGRAETRIFSIPTSIQAPKEEGPEPVSGCRQRRPQMVGK